MKTLHSKSQLSVSPTVKSYPLVGGKQLCDFPLIKILRDSLGVVVERFSDSKILRVVQVKVVRFSDNKILAVVQGVIVLRFSDNKILRVIRGIIVVRFSYNIDVAIAVFRF